MATTDLQVAPPADGGATLRQMQRVATFENHGNLRRFLGNFAKVANCPVGNLDGEFGNLELAAGVG